MPISDFRSLVPVIKNTSILCLLLYVFCLAATAQEVTVLTTGGDRITGLLLEYKDNVLEIETENGILRLPATELTQVSFTANRAQTSSEADRHLWSGKQFLALGMEDEALEEFKAAMHSSPMYARPHYEIGALLNRMGQKKEALQYFSRAIKLDPDLPDITARDFKDVAEVYLDDDNLENAADTYHLIYKTFPKSLAAAGAVYEAGFLYVKLGDNAKALEALEDAIAAFPLNQNAERALYEVGRLRQEAGSPEAAEGVLIQLISDFPASQWGADVHYILARIYLQQRRNEDAIQELAKVLDESTDADLIDKATRMLDECVWLVYTSSDGLPSNNIRALAQDGNYIWVGTAAGVTLFDLEKKEFANNGLLKEMDIQALAVDDLHLWIGTRNSGVKRYNKMDGTWKAFAEKGALFSDSVLAISIDEGGVWIGTAKNGVYRYGKFDGNWKNYTTSHGLPSDSIVSISSTPTSGLWCGTYEKGVSFFDGSSGRWQSDPGISNEASVTSIAAGAGYVWFVWYGKSSNGVSRYNVATKSWDLVQEVTTAAAGEVIGMINLAANDKEAWIGFETEAMLYDYVTLWDGPFSYPSNLSGSATGCVLIGDDAVWFGTPRGLGRLDRRLLKRVDHIKKIMGEDNENY